MTQSEGLEPLASSLMDDQDMRDLIAIFVRRLPTQIASMVQAAKGDQDASEEVVRCVHQLKGTGALVGFASISSQAGIVQDACRKALRHGEPLSGQAHTELETLILLCRRVLAWGGSMLETPSVG